MAMSIGRLASKCIGIIINLIFADILFKITHVLRIEWVYPQKLDHGFRKLIPQLEYIFIAIPIILEE